MSGWKPIEKFVGNDPKWVITYLYYGDEQEQAKPGYAGPWPEVHGWYETEEDALKVWAHFPKPNRYYVRKAHKRVML